MEGGGKGVQILDFSSFGCCLGLLWGFWAPGWVWQPPRTLPGPPGPEPGLRPRAPGPAQTPKRECHPDIVAFLLLESPISSQICLKMSAVIHTIGRRSGVGVAGIRGIRGIGGITL